MINEIYVQQLPTKLLRFPMAMQVKRTRETHSHSTQAELHYYVYKMVLVDTAACLRTISFLSAPKPEYWACCLLAYHLMATPKSTPCYS